jgi:hypothetical protein
MHMQNTYIVPDSNTSPYLPPTTRLLPPDWGLISTPFDTM